MNSQPSFIRFLTVNCVCGIALQLVWAQTLLFGQPADSVTSVPAKVSVTKVASE